VKESGRKAAHENCEGENDVPLTRHVGEISFHTLRDHLIEVHLTKG